MRLKLNPALSVHTGRYYSKWKGEVVDINDPEKRGRIKAIIPALFKPYYKSQKTDPSGNAIPFLKSDFPAVWCEPCFNPGEYKIPPIGTGVWVEFEAGELEHPIWVGIWINPVGTKQLTEDAQNILYGSGTGLQGSSNSIIIDKNGIMQYNSTKPQNGLVSMCSLCPFTGNYHIDGSAYVRMKGGSGDI